MTNSTPTCKIHDWYPYITVCKFQVTPDLPVSEDWDQVTCRQCRKRLKWSLMKILCAFPRNRLDHKNN